MCGLAGYVDFQNSPLPADLRRMEQSLSHRGPDEGDIWTDAYCGLAHRRLRVIDLSPRAAQPMHDLAAGRVVVFNGEIYNFQVLRVELEKLGCGFRSQSDTEILLHGYEKWGEALFARLRGMFAIAIWDQRERRLIFARDAFGKKPFFYYAQGSTMIFGSELVVFRQLPALTLRLSSAAFRAYMEFGYLSAPQTIFEQIEQLPPGHYGTWDERGIRLQRFFFVPESPPASPADSSVEGATEALEKSLRQAVTSRLVSDVPLGCFLSGGVDSSLIAALAQEANPSRLKTYTVGFTGSAQSEATAAAAVAAHLGTDHHSIAVDGQSLITDFHPILASASEPLGDDSFLPSYVISRETKREVTVALSGDGGDELFCGYQKYHQFAGARRWQGRIPAPGLALLGMLGRLPLGDRRKKSLSALSTGTALGLARWLSTLWKKEELGSLLAETFPPSAGGDFFDATWNRYRAYSEVERLMLTDVETYMVGDILTKVDRASMAAGLEVRSPFLDQQFFEDTLAYRVRALPGGGKAILRRILDKHLPRALYDRPKQGFGLPIEEWYRGPLRPLLLEYTQPERIARRGLLNPVVLQRVVDDHLSGRRNFARKLHAIVAFEVWADQYL
ncbi:MAG: asparagine synthase (glutamine-hydrolyzing) [Verrucomicrobiota bacterium]